MCTMVVMDYCLVIFQGARRSGHLAVVAMIVVLIAKAAVAVVAATSFWLGFQ